MIVSGVPGNGVIEGFKPLEKSNLGLLPQSHLLKCFLKLSVMGTYKIHGFFCFFTKYCFKTDV